MDERISKIFGPNALILIQMLIILVSFSSLTEFFYHYAEQHGALAGVTIAGVVQVSSLLSGLMAVGLDAASLTFTIAALKAWEASHDATMVIFPVFLMMLTSTYSAVGNYIYVSAQSIGYSQVHLFGVAADSIAPLMISSLPYLGVTITVAVPFIFPRTKAASDEEQEQLLRSIRQKAEIDEAKAQAGAKVWGARAGSAVAIAKQTGIGKGIAERLGVPIDEEGAEADLEDDGPNDPSQPEVVGVGRLTAIYNRAQQPKNRIAKDGRTIRAWANAGRIPGHQDERGYWQFDLRELEQHPDFERVIRKYRADEEKKKLGGKAGPSRPLPVSQQERWTQSGPLAAPPAAFMQTLEKTPPISH